jgi:hypothetical protein
MRFPHSQACPSAQVHHDTSPASAPEHYQILGVSDADVTALRMRAAHQLRPRPGDLTKCTPPGKDDSPMDDPQSINITVNDDNLLHHAQISRWSNLPLGGPGFCDVTKISYSLLLDKNASLAGLPPARSWVLYGPFADTSLVREALTLSIGYSLGLKSTPLVEFIELVYREQKDNCAFSLDTDYRGVYLVMNAVQRGAYQVDVPIDPDPTKVEQGYVLRLSTAPSASTVSVPMGPSVNGSVARTLALDFVDPSAPTQPQIAAVVSVFHELNTHLFQDGQASCGAWQMRARCRCRPTGAAGRVADLARLRPIPRPRLVHQPLHAQRAHARVGRVRAGSVHHRYDQAGGPAAGCDHQGRAVSAVRVCICGDGAWDGPLGRADRLHRLAERSFGCTLMHGRDARRSVPCSRLSRRQCCQ